jgi:hypothetical protein
MSDMTPGQLAERREALKRSAWVSVLNDNDTYTGLDGCWIALTSEEKVTALDDDSLSVDDLPQERRFSLNDLLMLAIDAGIFDDWLLEKGGLTCPTHRWSGRFCRAGQTPNGGPQGNQRSMGSSRFHRD